MKIKNKEVIIPKIAGAKKGGNPTVAPNSLFSTDIVFITNAFGEGPVYRINPNGPQDIEINDSKIDDLLNLDGDGSVDTKKFTTVSTPGTITQGPLPLFGEATVTPQAFNSVVKLRKGNIDGIPSSSVTNQETSTASIDSLRFNFSVDALLRADNEGNVYPYSATIKVTIWNNTHTEIVHAFSRAITDKTDTPYKFSLQYNFSDAEKAAAAGNGFTFDVEKISNDSDNTKIQDSINFVGWDEINNNDQAYPRTALIGYGLKAADEHTGGVPNFTSLIKGLLVKVPANYNQPTLADGEVDWRHLEVAESGTLGYTQKGYYLQQSGSTIQYAANPVIYNGVWDGTFVYSWTQNPVWIIYDILTNKTYGLGIPENNIDKYKFYQVAQYCDACDASTGKFIGVDGLADGTFRNKPRDYRTEVRELLLGLNKGIPIKERRFITDITVSDNDLAIDIINRITSTFRALLIYSGGKITMSVDMPDEYPVMLFNSVNIKQGSLQMSGVKESDTMTGIDVAYLEPDNHYKREVLRINGSESNDGTEMSDYEKISSVDLKGVTRRSQAIRTGQYQLASSKYVRRMVSFEAGPDAVYITPGDLIAVSTNSSGIVYGYGGKVSSNSSVGVSADTNVFLEHFTSPAIDDTVFTDNTYPIALRVLKTESDAIDIYLVSNTDYSLSSSSNVTSGADYARVSILQKYDTATGTFANISSFSGELAPTEGDLWSLGEFENLNNYFTSKTDKLFKVTEVNRDPKEFTVGIHAIEYISNVYEDSDTFINYDPVSYTKVQSPIITPPTPTLSVSPALKEQYDGSVRADVKVESTTNKDGYDQKFSTEYYVASPTSLTHIKSLNSTSPYEFTLANASGYNVGDKATIVGRNGYTSRVGEISLRCTQKETVAPNSIKLTIPGLSLCTNPATSSHVLDDYATYTNENPKISIPVKIAEQPSGDKNFVGYYTNIETIYVDIVSYDLLNDTVTILNENSSLYSLIPTEDFIVNIKQVAYSANLTGSTAFYITPTKYEHINEGELTTGANYVDLHFKPMSADYVRMLVDGVETEDFTVNLNTSLSIPANVMYTALSSDYYYRVESDHYIIPNVEVGDKLTTGYNNTFTVTGSTFDSSSTNYDAQLTSNHIYRVYTDKEAIPAMSSYQFTNITQDPVGTITSKDGNNVVFSYDSNTYTSTFNLANSTAYFLSANENYQRVFVPDSGYISELPVGNVAVKARNKTVVGRASPFVTKRTYLEQLPIKKVTDLAITESLYREQTGGVSVRVTCSFTPITNQQVTEYEISYKLLFGNPDPNAVDYTEELVKYNTVQVSAQSVDSDGKIRFSVPNINRGSQAYANSVEFRVVPINKTIRGIAAYISSDIEGKTAKPQNVKNFTGGQQTDQVTLFWEYDRTADGELTDLDLKEVVIHRIEGDYSSYTNDALTELFISSQALVTVAAGTQRKSIPIDIYGTYTYLARTRDTSGNYSESTVGTVIRTSRPKRNTVVQAFNEDSPSVSFTNITNTNSSEYNFPSFANSVTGGLSGTGATSVDLANGSSTGFEVSGSVDDLLAGTDAEYITQIRDFGTVTHAAVSLDVQVTQLVEVTYNDLHTVEFNGVSELSTDSSVLVDTGIGDTILNPSLYTSTGYDAVNETYTSTVGSTTKVWAIWNPGQFVGDTSNANSYALIASVINSNAIALGETFYANGNSTGTNVFSNVTLVPSSYQLVDLTQYNDTSETFTYQGDLAATSTQTFIRTSSADTVYYANGNVNVQAFDSSSVNDGWVPYEAGSRPIRHYQLKFLFNNNEPNTYDIILDKLRYTLEKEQTLETQTVVYSGSPTTVDYSNSSFVYRPVLTYTILDQVNPGTNPAIAVTTGATNTSATFKLYYADGSGEYPADGTANVMISIIGV